MSIYESNIVLKKVIKKSWSKILRVKCSFKESQWQNFEPIWVFTFQTSNEFSRQNIISNVFSSRNITSKEFSHPNIISYEFSRQNIISNEFSIQNIIFTSKHNFKVICFGYTQFFMYTQVFWVHSKYFKCTQMSQFMYLVKSHFWEYQKHFEYTLKLSMLKKVEFSQNIFWVSRWTGHWFAK